MNSFAHFEDQFGHLQLSDNDAALHVFLAGWNSAMMEMMQRVNKMPFGDDTRASFAVYFQSQIINVDAIEKPAQQQDADHDFKNFHRSLCERFNYVHDEKDWKRDLVSLEEWIAKKVQPEQEPVAVVSGYYGGKCVILPIDPARIYNSNTPLYTAPSPCPTCEALARTVMLDHTSHDAQRTWVGLTLEEYDAGLLNDFGGGNVDWWWDYIRAELGRAYEHYQSQMAEQPAPVAEPRKQTPVATKLETQQFNCFHVSAEDFQKLKDLPVGTKLYTSPQPAQRKPLTPLEIENLRDEHLYSVHGVIQGHEAFTRAIEAAHGIKGDA